MEHKDMNVITKGIMLVFKLLGETTEFCTLEGTHSLPSRYVQVQDQTSWNNASRLKIKRKSIRAFPK